MKLFFTDGQKQGKKHELAPPGISIGRELDNDIVLEQEGASRYHAKLEWKDANWYLKDLGSTNGTNLNGEKITPNSEIKLKEGDNIKVGKQTMHFAEQFDESKQSGLAIISHPDTPVEPSAVTISDMTPSKKEQPEDTKNKKDAVIGDSKSFLNFFDKKDSDEEKSPEPAKKMDFFGKQDSPDTNKGKASKPHAGMLFYVAVVAAAIFLIAGFLIFKRLKNQKSSDSTPTTKIRKSSPLLLRYEKQITTSKPNHNIFRFLMEIKNGTITVTRDDLQAGLKDQPSRKIGPEKLLELEEQLQETDFMSVKQGQRGLPKNGEDRVKTLTIAYGKEFNSIMVNNASSPRSFEKAVRVLEDFSDNVLNIRAISLTPKELREDGMNAFRRGKQLFENYRAQNENLYKTKILLKIAIENLGSFHPEPPEYNQAYKMREEATRLLQDQIHAHERNANQYFRSDQFVQAKEEYQSIMEKTEPGSKVYNTSRERIITIEENIRIKRRKRR